MFVATEPGESLGNVAPRRARLQNGFHTSGNRTRDLDQIFADEQATVDWYEGRELYGRRRDGTEFPVEISLSPLDTEGGTLVCGAVRDITERKRAEEELQQLVDFVPQIIVVLDSGGNSVHLNSSMLTLTFACGFATTDVESTLKCLSQGGTDIGD